MSEKDNTVDYDVQPLVNLLNGALIEGYGNTDYSLFESSGLGHICRVSSGLAVPPRKTATLFAVSGDLLAAAAIVVRMHDSNCLSHPGDSRSIERLRELIAKVEQA